VSAKGVHFKAIPFQSKDKMRTQKKTVRNGRSKTAAVIKLAERKQLTAKRREMAKRVPAPKHGELPVGRTSADRNIIGLSGQVGVDSVARSAQAFIGAGSTDKIEKVIEKWAANVEQFSRTGAAVSQGFREISREWVSWTRARDQNSQHGFMALMQCRSPHEFFEVQNRIINQNLELFSASTKRMIEISSEMTSKVSPKITPAV
jgi:hypothetical protein